MTATVEHPQGHIDDYPEGPVLRDEVDAGELITRVEDLPDEVKADIIAQREAGTTLHELKGNFPAVDPAVIRDVLPPMNKREATQRAKKEAKVTESKQGVGGRSGEAKSEPKPKTESKPKVERYSTDTDLVVSLSERTLACRQVMGRNALAEALDTTGSAVWRFEQGRIHPAEVEPLYEAIAKVEDRIAAGEFVKPEKQPAAKSPSKAALEARIDAAITGLREAAADKKVTKAAAIATALERLDPPQPTA
jgi:ribosome-binding protein aMBF1 (putative translation factor)